MNSFWAPDDKAKTIDLVINHFDIHENDLN